jgi:hypothetical protein
MKKEGLRNDPMIYGSSDHSYQKVALVIDSVLCNRKFV